MSKLLIIGGGPGGYVAAIRGAQLGAEVTLVEKNKLGGTCLNVGCIPTKVLLHAADLYTEAKNAENCGIHVTGVTVDWAMVQARREGISKQLVSGIKGLMTVNKIKVIEGTASLISNTKATITRKNGTIEIVDFNKVIIATGSTPFVPLIPGVKHTACIDSTGALELEFIPESMVIIGGGVIGVEIATVYSTFGCRVTIVEMLQKILANMDEELTAVLRKKLEKSGVKIYTGAKVVGIEDANGKAKVVVEYEEKKLEIETEKVLVAVGRKADTSMLNLEICGVATERGMIQVNDRMETNIHNIYAIGDCTGKLMLAHVAFQQGEVAAENAMGEDVAMDYKTTPLCVYTNPEFASVGLTESQAKEKGIDFVVGKFPLTANGKSLIMESTEGYIKIVADKKYKEILGVHILGARATDLITEGALAIRLEATIEELISTIHAHPTVGEAMKEAALAVEKRAIHIQNK